jgi:hypothetical protein
MHLFAEEKRLQRSFMLFSLFKMVASLRDSEVMGGGGDGGGKSRVGTW